MRNTGLSKLVVLAVVCLTVLASVAALYSHRSRVNSPDPAPGPVVPYKEFSWSGALEVPFILWGGDVATFLANGGLETKADTVFHKHGLNLKLVPGDDFEKQVKRYLEGESPFLRGTVSMLAQASDQLNADERSRPVVFLQLTWSAGDHLVSRGGLRTLGDLKGKKVALQRGGPHVGMLGDILRTARLDWNRDVTIAWTDDVTGDKGPAELFRKDNSIDACFAITPDMMDLTGGLDKSGTGKDKTVKDAHVLVSTAHMKRSIADVYACRKDFYDKNKDLVEKFAAGYLKACEDLLDLRKKWAAKDKDATTRYEALLGMARTIYGKEVLRDNDAADGLVQDAVFVGLPGNVSFFTDRGNLSGFEGKQKVAFEVAIANGDAKARLSFLSAGLDYEKLKKLGGLTGKPPPEKNFNFDLRFLNENTIYSFNIYFDPNQWEFPAERYKDEFQRALEQASLFGNAAVVVRGHTDPNPVAWEDFQTQGIANGVLNQKDGRLYLKNGEEIERKDWKKIFETIEKENFGNDLKQFVKNHKKLSEDRAEVVRKSVLQFAADGQYRLDEKQMRSAGASCLEPVVAVQTDEEDHQKNRRVEFRIVKVAVETTTDFDY